MAEPTVKELAPEAPASGAVDSVLEALGLPKEVPEGADPEEGEQAPVALATPEGAPPVEAGKEVKPVVEAEVKKPEEKPPLTKFQVFDEGGELEVPANLKFTFTANGKTREDVPLEKVVALAQMGYYNHEREQALEQKANEANQAIEASRQLGQAVQMYEAQLRQLLEDPEYADRARSKWSEYNSPEQKLRRENEELKRANDNTRAQQVEAAAAQFVATRVAPVFESIMKANPTVNEHELLGRYTQVVSPLLVNGRVPFERLQDVERLVQHDLAYWAQGQHTARTEAESVKQQEVKTATAKAAAVKRQLARAAAPQGTAAPDTATVKPAATAREWLNNMFPTAGD